MNLQDVPASVRGCFEQTPEVLNGKLRVCGTRISVEQMLELLAAGVRPDEMVASFPVLTAQDVTAVEQIFRRPAFSPRSGR